MNGAYTEETEQKTDNADLQAGAALYLEKDGEELAEAVTEVDAGAIVEEAAEAEKASDVVMANVSDAWAEGLTETAFHTGSQFVVQNHQRLGKT